MIRQPFTEFIRGISRANVTAIYETQTFNTYSRYIQDQRDWHMPYTMRQPFNELLRGISSSTWLRQPVTEFLRGISRTNVTRPTQIWSANPSLSFYEVYPGPTWLPCTKRRSSIHTRDISRYRRDCHMPYTMRQHFNELLGGISSPTWLPYTLQWASTRHFQGQCDCHIWYANTQWASTFNELLQGISSPTWLPYTIRKHSSVAKTQSCNNLPQFPPRAVLIIILELGAKPCLVVVNDG